MLTSRCRDGLTCARIIRDYEHKGLLGRPASEIEPLGHTPGSSVSPISATQDVSISSREGARLPILAVSANARTEQMQQALAAGMDDAIAKPFRIPELWSKVWDLIPRLKIDSEQKS
jgi:CheY-like chemotaxis protein